MIAPDGFACAVVAGFVAALPSLLVYGRVRRLEDESHRDHLTGLRSGRLLDDDLALLGRTEAPLALLLVDLDDFRRFNELGYREHGDRALQLAATTIRRTLQRAGDRIYRMHTAGDEFVIFFSVETARDAYRQAERLRVALAAAKVPGSIGIAFAEGSTHRDPAQLLRLATTNKDAAKNRGGNFVFPPPDEPPPPPVPVAVELARPNLVTALAGSGGRT